MKDRPILFSAPMVRALLDGRKTQTRRIVKDAAWREDGTDPDPVTGHRCSDWYIDAQLCPYGQTGDRLWVREAWRSYPMAGNDGTAAVLYRATHPEAASIGPWKPSIHMPRRACRLILEVTGVRVERLQDISEADAQAEGTDPINAKVPSHREAFRYLWDDINGAGAWDANPWVWVLEFRKVAP